MGGEPTLLATLLLSVDRMPLTFPSHAAAVLPLSRARGWLPPSALVVGSTAPDLAYLFDTTHLNFHRWPGLLWPCLPIAFGVWLLFEVLLLPWLDRLLVETWGPATGVLTRTRGAPTNVRGALAALAGLAVGALTHVAWDGFTHAWRWPASALYPSVHVGHWLLTDWLQASSHLVGAALVVRAVLSLTPTVRWGAPRLTDRGRGFALVLLACELTAFAMLASTGVAPSATPTFTLAWSTFWWGARALLIALTLCAVTERVRPFAFRAG
jgi:hypothetical protein